MTKQTKAIIAGVIISIIQMVAIAITMAIFYALGVEKFQSEALATVLLLDVVVFCSFTVGWLIVEHV